MKILLVGIGIYAAANTAAKALTVTTSVTDLGHKTLTAAKFVLAPVRFQR